jgi:hypothetical protein
MLTRTGNERRRRDADKKRGAEKDGGIIENDGVGIDFMGFR